MLGFRENPHTQEIMSFSHVPPECTFYVKTDLWLHGINELPRNLATRNRMNVANSPDRFLEQRTAFVGPFLAESISDIPRVGL